MFEEAFLCLALMAVSELAKGIQYEDPIKTGCAIKYTNIISVYACMKFFSLYITSNLIHMNAILIAFKC